MGVWLGLLLIWPAACAQGREEGSVRASFVINDRVRKAVAENLPLADQGDGTYENPILAGDFPDPSIIRVGQEYYMTHSGSGTPGLLIWHSRDLVNWRPIGKALTKPIGEIWAPELVYHERLFYIYVTVVKPLPDGGRRFTNVVLGAREPAGPWTEPIDLKIGRIDPGHVVAPGGRRYLYLSDGHMVGLTDDGAGVRGTVEKVYDGWPYPDDWVVECKCLEAPKLVRRRDYYYLLSAQGGTSGPSTGHMIIVARSQSVRGPWENSPLNPLLRTQNRKERWWSQGHGTLIEGVDGSWWVIYHAYENGNRTLGRQTLLMPVEWTDDGWPRIVEDYNTADAIPMPVGDNVGHGMPLSDNFLSDEIGPQWRYWETQDPGDRYRAGLGRLRMQATGSSVTDAAMLTCNPANTSYQVQVEIECPPTAEAGLLLHSRDNIYGGACVKQGKARTYWRSREHTSIPWTGQRVFLRLRNVEHDVALYCSKDGLRWKKFDKGIEVSRGFGVLRIALYAAGSGEVVFRQFMYRGLD